MLREFKEFALKGNMVDMAIGIVIGAAFGTVVASLVADILTPLLASLFQAPDFTNLFVVLRNPTGAEFATVADARKAGAVVLSYGGFLNTVVSFLLVALALFMIVKAINRLRRTKAEVAAVAEPPAPTPQEVILSEIRDLLAAQTGSTLARP
jgi:large conductance mechanosensitive channel